LIGSDIWEGKGIMRFSDKATYEGWWKDNKKVGKGRLIHTDGTV